MPAATGIQVTVDSVVQVPICRPSGEQMDAPGELHEPVEEPVDAVPEPDAGAALEPDELSMHAGTEPLAEDGEAGTAAEGEAATEGATAATEGEAATAGAAADIEGAAADATAAGAPEAPELPALEA